MSDSKRATLITVGAKKSANNNVNKTVRLTINLYESNESKYPELNYKELVIAEERKKKQENGKTAGLDPFSDNDDDVERVARKFEQKYGGNSTYGKKGRTKVDDFADIGAGYDENDSFIDNTDGYDEMIPPECDTLYGGFYINSGELEFKNVPENQLVISDAEPGGNRKNKRRISSSSSDDSSESSSGSSHDEKEKPVVNGTVDSHETEHRKKKNKKIDKKKAKKKQRTDSSAATSGKQTSDDNGHGDGESVDSRTSQSDSLTSKPTPSSENAVTSDSSRDVEHKAELKLPPIVAQTLDECESLITRHRQQNPAINSPQLQEKLEPHLFRLDRALQKPHADIRTRRIAWTRVAKALKTSRASLLQKVKQMSGETKNLSPQTQASTIVTSNSTTTNNNKRKAPENADDINVSNMTEEEKEAKIVETLKRLKALIDERTPGMMANYNAECERVQEERKKIQIASVAEGAPHIEKRLPKRRFPWCGRSRSLLLRLRNLTDSDNSALLLLTNRALPLFPHGFVRLPTLLRQADLSKEMKAADVKRQRVGSVSQQTRPPPTSQPPPATQPPPALPFSEPIQFPASLTVTATVKTLPENNESPSPTNDKDKKSNSVFGSILNSFSLSKDLLVEAEDRRKETDKKEDLYIPPNSIGSITITPVPNQKQDKKTTNAVVENKHKEPLLRVKSPAALNEMVNMNNKDINIKKDKEKQKKIEKNHTNIKEKRVNSPLHIDTSYQTNKKDPSPKTVDEVTKKQIESMRNAESNIPRPALVPVHHSPTFAKPDKRPPEVKKKKDIVIISDVDPLAEVPNDPVAIDDSSSDVELIEDSKNTDKIVNNDVVPSKDLVNNKKDSNQSVSDKSEQLDEAIKDDIDIIMRNIREMEHSQEPTKMNSFGGVIASAKHEASKASCLSSRPVFQESRSDRNKFAERTSLNKTDGCNNSITG